MEQYPPTIDVRFTKDQILEMVKEKYQLNAYLLSKIFSVTKEGSAIEESSDSETSSEENQSLFDSSDEDSNEESNIEVMKSDQEQK